MFNCVLMAHCHDAMGWSVRLLVFWWLIVTTPWVGLCVCSSSNSSLSRHHGLVCVFACVLIAHCHDAMGWSVCLFVFNGSLSRRHGWVCVLDCVLVAHCHDAMDCSVAHCHDVMGWSVTCEYGGR